MVKKLLTGYFGASYVATALAFISMSGYFAAIFLLIISSYFWLSAFGKIPQKYDIKSWKGAVGYGFLGLIISLSLLNVSSKSQKTQQPVSVAKTESTTTSVTPQATPTPTPTPQATESNIPGVMPVDVYLNLENEGFSTTKELNPCCSWFSVKGDMSSVRYLAEVYGNSASSFYRVNASVTTTIDKNTNAIARPFFGYIATLNYSGSKPDDARKWVEKNIGKKAKTIIGGVTIELDRGQKNGLWLSLYKE